MPFEKGVSNKFSGAFKEAVQIVYNRLGGHAAFLGWARDNQSEFYRIAARLIPGETQEGHGTEHVTIIVSPSRLPVLEVRPAPENHSADVAESVKLL
jgi:hypothetical protein